jgi:hypothetical protein
MATRYYSCDIGAGVPSNVTEGSATRIVEIATPTADTFVLADTGGTLPDSTTYGYRVSATDADGETLAFTEVTQATGTGGSPDEHTITVKWLEVTGATGYRVYRDAGDGGLHYLLATVAAPTLEYLDDGSATLGTAVPVTENTTNADNIEYRVVYTTTGVDKTGVLKALRAIADKIALASVPSVHTFYGVALGGDIPLDVTVATSTTSAIYELEVAWSDTGCTRLKVLNAIGAIAGYITRDTFPPT